MNTETNSIIIKSLKPFHPKKIGVFGSYSRGEMNENSDIDILYSFHQPISLFDLVGIKLRLEELLNRKVDIVSEQGINKYLKPYIMQDLKIIYKDDEE